MRPAPQPRRYTILCLCVAIEGEGGGEGRRAQPTLDFFSGSEREKLRREQLGGKNSREPKSGESARSTFRRTERERERGAKVPCCHFWPLPLPFSRCLVGLGKTLHVRNSVVGQNRKANRSNDRVPNLMRKRSISRSSIQFFMHLRRED